MEQTDDMKRDLIDAAHRVVKTLRMKPRARGDAARDARNWRAAIEAYEAHLATDASDTAIWIQLGHAYKEEGELDHALEAYLRAEALDGRDADLLLNLGHLHKLRGELDLALADYDRSATLQPALFGGAAMVEREKILGRTTWLGDDGTIPANLTTLVAAIEAAERAGRRIFDGYYNSFATR